MLLRSTNSRDENSPAAIFRDRIECAVRAVASARAPATARTAHLG